MKKHIIDNTSFKTCLQLLKYLSKDDLSKKFDKVIFLIFIHLNQTIFFVINYII